MIQQYICENKMLIRLLWPVIYMRSNTKRGFKQAVALMSFSNTVLSITKIFLHY